MNIQTLIEKFGVDKVCDLVKQYQNADKQINWKIGKASKKRQPKK